jgi:hypothetical protein
MARTRNGAVLGSETKVKLEDDIDGLFKLPLAEFTGARNSLAARLKQAGSANDANLVKALAKPSISAWAVNQLYWKQREAFDRLLAAGQRFRQAQTSRTSKKISDMRGSLNTRREALTHLSDLATALLRDAGHNPTTDTMHRITTTLEGISAYASLSGGPVPGRLTHDVDPPGFESLASFVPTGRSEGTRESARMTLAQAKPVAATNPSQKATSARDVRQLEETRQNKLAAAKVSLQAAKKSLTEAQTRAQQLHAAHKKANAEAKQAEKQLREAEERFTKARATSEETAQREQSIAAEIEEAANSVEEVRRTVDKLTKELESLLRGSTTR